ncbi:LRR receptor-like serine threonine-protein kinase [Musa troglodytarum]|uniref:LRR receptor-like serine threonine-protein kinase n=1 Tax=Musa troglodytarum TaxID=320322 RepID=A0A9E7EYA4_9LILI|nr:LRR receptor-like serine threonine-protein kinase [Musa troglodytarum]
MGGRTPLLVLTFSLAVLSIKLGISHGCRETERKALIDFKRGLHDPSNRLSSWVGEDCCAWEGVGCSNISGHVIKLDLRNDDDPGCKWALRGDITPSLPSLQQLNRLDLSGNYFMHKPIPKFLGAFRRLTYLNLSGAGFMGRVPAQLGNLSTLQHLDLSYNCYLSLENSGWISLLTSLRHLNMTWVSFTNAANWLQDLNALPHVQEIELISCDLGTFPRSLSHVNFTSLTTLDLRGNYINSTIPDWVFNITSLEFLYLGGNDLHGFFPDSVTKLTSLKALDLSGTQLSGSFPDWLGNIKNLKSLDLSSNSLCGSVPASIGNLSLLQHLSLGSNDLNGTISKDDLANLSSLEYLDISYNFIELNKSDDWIPPFQLQSLSMDFCQIGPTPQFPQWLRTQTTLRQLQLSSAGIKDMFFDRLPSSLEYLDLSYNSLHGSLPASLGNLSMLRSLDLSDNKITGEVPQFFPKLKYLYLSNNSFSGNLSPRITNTMPSLQWFDLSMNNMSGEIPFSYCQLRNLEGLQLYENNLSRVIPNCWKTSSNLLLLDLSSNKLVGGVPDSLCNLQMLESLHLSHNNLSGQIPHCLKSCTELATLDLGHNNFIGNIPTWIGESLLYLKTLSLRSNAFTGSIPQLSSLPSLRILDLSNNNLSGTIPQSFGDFNALKSAPTYQCCYFNNDSLYVEDMWLFIKGSELEYTTRQLSMDTLIDLSNNYLSGNIPEELGNLHGLRSLNLSKNYLIGQIPWSIGRMKQLEVLDLSRNNLSGAIPSDLAALNFLNHLNLSYNNLSGRIPNGNQLQTFTDSSIYAGNPNLCGPPLTKNCTLNIAKAGEEEQNEDSSKSRMETLWLYTSITLGFIIGFWAICGSLLLQQTWRTSYFRAIDNMFDKLYVMMVVTVAKYKRKL